MKVELTSQSLLDALKSVKRAIPSRSALPVLSGVLLEVDGDMMKVCATNLEIGIVLRIPVKVEEEGGIVIPYAALVATIGASDTIRLETDDKKREMTILAHKYRSRLLGLEPAEFPLMEEKGDNAVTFELEVNEFRNMYRAVDIAVSQDASRPVLTGVCLRPDMIASADGYRLSHIPFDSGVDGELIIPHNMWQLMGDILDGEDPTATCIADVARTGLVASNRLTVKYENAMLISQLIDGNFPDVERIMPDLDGRIKVTLDPDRLREILTPLKYVAGQAAHIIKWSLDTDSDEVRVTTSTTTVGDVEVRLPTITPIEWANDDADPVVVALNVKYLADYLGVVKDAEYLEAYIESTEGPVVFVAPSHPGFTHIVMPMHVAA
jgi:DNA polymerase-3 subunit beta